MDLIRALRRRTTIPRAFVIESPGGRAVRWAVEQELRRRGWSLALTPADTNLMIVCGTSGDALREAVNRVWDSVPRPRSLLTISAGTDPSRALDTSLDRLLADLQPVVESEDADLGHSSRTGESHHRPASESEHEHGNHDEHQTHEAHSSAHDGNGDHGGGHHGGHDEGHGAGHGGGHGMHEHGGDVAGLPMAERAGDRDGLTLDRVHLTLGPVLTDWPAGLRIRLGLQGDVVQDADVTVVDLPGTPPETSPQQAVALDRLAVLLSVSGWAVGARRARRLRDEIVDGQVDEPELRRFTRAVRRSRTLRWATDSLGPVADPTAGVPLKTSGTTHDATARWRGWLDVVDGAAMLADPVPVDRVAALLVGQELAAVRVIVASLGLDVVAHQSGSVR